MCDKMSKKNWQMKTKLKKCTALKCTSRSVRFGTKLRFFCCGKRKGDLAANYVDKNYKVFHLYMSNQLHNFNKIKNNVLPGRWLLKICIVSSNQNLCRIVFGFRSMQVLALDNHFCIFAKLSSANPCGTELSASAVNACSILTLPQINLRLQLMSPITASCDFPFIIPLIITIIIIIISLLQFITRGLNGDGLML